jgi:hypothetical protein
MKNLSSKFASISVLVTGKSRVIYFIFTLVLFVLAAAAPEATGSVGR